MTKNTQNSKPSFRVIYWLVFPLDLKKGEPMSPYALTKKLHWDRDIEIQTLEDIDKLSSFSRIDYNSNFIATHSREEVTEWLMSGSDLFTEEKVFYIEYGDNLELIECIFQAATETKNHKYYIRLGSVVDANKTWSKLQSGELVQPDNLHIRKYLGKDNPSDKSGFISLEYSYTSNIDELDFFPEKGKKDPVFRFIPNSDINQSSFGFLNPTNSTCMSLFNLN